MISYIKGELAAVGEEQVVVEVQGIGYGIFMPGQAMTMLLQRGTVATHSLASDSGVDPIPRRSISLSEYSDVIKRRRMALLDKHTSLSRRVEANSQFASAEPLAYDKKGRS